MKQFRGLFAGLTTIDIQYFVDVFPSSNKKVKTALPKITSGDRQPMQPLLFPI